MQQRNEAGGFAVLESSSGIVHPVPFVCLHGRLRVKLRYSVQVAEAGKGSGDGYVRFPPAVQQFSFPKRFKRLFVPLVSSRFVHRE
jgi:hypothetical protein